MLLWSILFLLAALVAGLLGFSDGATSLGAAARSFFFIFLLLFALTLLSGSAPEVSP